MIQLYPHQTTSDDDHAPSESDIPVVDIMASVGAEERPGRADRPWVYTNMISSADGATAVDGLSGDLGGEGDRAMFRALRSQADAILVGASTARAEEYRPPIAYPDSEGQRRRRGQGSRPRLVLISNSLDLESSLPLFADETDKQPLIITSQRSLEARGHQAPPDAPLLAAGQDQVELGRAITELGRQGYCRILCEGGPTVNGQLAAAGLIDEWNLTIAPLLAVGESKRAAVGPIPNGPPPNMTLARVWLDDHYLFCRWVRRR